MNKPPIDGIPLTCCCCGRDAGVWKQWWNRDAGYGLCASCGADLAKKESAASMRDAYGDEGVHRAPNQK